uniref:Uncharacterized protein n=1 Tax=Pipistrellus kuhlii TaxID=59472 RepID=A0A7J7VBX2_PIPKU|nr:hypothetical protein mPipKuh1_008518 [Pipistrellus kuhlii]
MGQIVKNWDVWSPYLRGTPQIYPCSPFPHGNTLEWEDWLGEYTRTQFPTLGSFCKACSDPSFNRPRLVTRCSPFLEAEASKDFLCARPFRTRQASVSAPQQTSYGEKRGEAVRACVRSGS